jgi:inosine-uridine nucleoside N-ribohydrolase
MFRTGAAFAILFALFTHVQTHDRPAPARHRIIFDTDFALPPQDDGLALALALGSPELEILGITTVAGNYNVARANADALRMLEIAGRPEIGVYAGAARPLNHTKDDYAASHHGRWWSDEAPREPPGGFAKKTLERETAVDFIVRTVLAHPGDVEIVAVGPLTNIARALKQQPEIVKAIKRMIIMGGAIGLLPDGAGNITPAAEFNFWVDAEAARQVLRSGIPIELSPLNASRKTAFTKPWYEKLAASGTPLARLIQSEMARTFDYPSAFVYMYDELAVASVVDSTLLKTKKLVVDVDDTYGIDYGASIGGTEVWPGAEGARMIDVQYDVDVARFMEMFVDRVGRPPVGRPFQGRLESRR